MSTLTSISSKTFLKASQKGNITKLKELASTNDIKDWTVYRHEASGDTALHLAAREGRLDVVKYLCETWKEPPFRTEVANKDMKRPVHDAAQSAKLDVLEYLLGQGAAVDPLKRADWTPLMLACTKVGEEAASCVKALLRHGAASELQNKDGWTPLMVACRTGNVDVVKCLMTRSSRSVYMRSKNGRSPLHVAAFHGCRNVIDLILSQDSDLINWQDSSGSTPLLESVKSGDLPTFQRLIDSKANVNAIDNVGQNVLHIAAQCGNTEIIEYILNRKLIDVESPTLHGITPLMFAEKNKQLKAIKILSSFQTR
ncbi:ankyrin repeat domain-containing protein 16 [Neodiprion pinetum]|uniref:ankyrin repeat domain-containing protein 16 n=1 Tax=Neodiprion pinetum TaxID=441929 RepID=UPI001EE0AFA9|nr:ankyrin repeat domain-containing protein 16-like [Neodiprion pinetum]XP_046483005.1 ankyrin repeat domain-containing protein 16-like [Neodiprion pinetum]XP_046483006.1 ankyrin repeat domain-containing protein 16-like [Neodiprion pinetum]XP_046483007.1 ankyrin repeat domain-containing protein 16-like [Neodiprion pinetum]XP_046483008.1 ankyrin repeat domain-containing protein 16-like [Neodiprion pinetum]